MNSFEIKDPTLDAAAIKKIIAERIDQRRAEAKEQGLDFERLAQPVSLEEQSRAAMDSMLKQAEAYQAAILVESGKISSGQGWLGRLLGRLKKPFQQLVIYHVNTLGRKQIIFNQSVSWGITAHQAHLEQLQAQIDRLEQTVKDLEAQIARQQGQGRE